jgi:hypothetical protein
MKEDRLVTHLHARFLQLLPRIETHARICFRDIRCAHKRADSIAEAIALSWKWLLRLCQLGKNVEEFPATFATLVVRAVRSGRKVAGMSKAKDVLNPMTQRLKNFMVEKLPDVSTLTTNPLAEALADNTITPPPDAVAFRIDFPSWVATRSARDRRVIADLMVGERTLDVSRKFGISPGRVSQLRTDFLDDWTLFCADPHERSQPCRT